MSSDTSSSARTPGKDLEIPLSRMKGAVLSVISCPLSIGGRGMSVDVEDPPQGDILSRPAGPLAGRVPVAGPPT
ncbi:hypothetical protein GCM10023175_60900 [Pseudonocardia xishanensis]|uniref:Uncharacterized protein n=1 Tax=Pseudonocardia xishanensis TaxID=630995 RepID=A0ABP8S169_9PSEU